MSQRDAFEVYQFGDPELTRITSLHSLTGEKQDYQELKQQFAGNAGAWTDPEFPPNATTLGERGRDTANNSIDETGKPVEWYRASDAIQRFTIYRGGEWQAPVPGATSVFSCSKNITESFTRCDVVQGGIGDCFFVAALSATTSDKPTLEFAVPSDNMDGPDSGVYHFRLWTQGCWVDVVVDDWLPFTKYRTGEYASYGAQIPVVGQKAELWVALAEKAYAKILGGYANIAAGGQAVNSLQALTGGFAEAYNLDGQSQEKGFYEKLKDCLDKTSSLVALSSKSSKAPRKDPVLDSIGLKYPHAYAVIRAETVKVKSGYSNQEVQLVKIYNPHGRNEFNGDWSDFDAAKPYGKWSTVSQSEKERLNLDPNPNSEDGDFWMSYYDMVKYFKELQIISLVRREQFQNKPPMVFEAYDFDGTNSGEPVAISTGPFPGITDTYVFADIIGKPPVGYLRSLQSALRLQKAGMKPIVPYGMVAEQIPAMTPGRQFTNPYTGQTVTYDDLYPSIKPIEGTDIVASRQGSTSIAYAWKAQPGLYNLIPTPPGNGFAYTIRVLYLKSG